MDKGLKERINEIDHQMEKLEASMNAVPMDSETYAILQKRYDEFAKLRKELVPLTSKKWYVFDKITEKLILISGNVIIPAVLGGLSYKRDGELVLCNARIWNLATRFLRINKT